MGTWNSSSTTPLIIDISSDDEIPPSNEIIDDEEIQEIPVGDNSGSNTSGNLQQPPIDGIDPFVNWTPGILAALPEKKRKTKLSRKVKKSRKGNRQEIRDSIASLKPEDLESAHEDEVKDLENENSNKTIDLVDSEEFVDLKPGNVSTPKKAAWPPYLSPNDTIFNASFEMLKKPEKPKELNPRKKADRRKMPGQTCKCCEKYYDSLGLDPVERQKRINASSRHRSNIRRAKTPEHFWDIDFPSTQVMLERGWFTRVPKKNKDKGK